MWIVILVVVIVVIIAIVVSSSSGEKPEEVFTEGKLAEMGDNEKKAKEFQDAYLGELESQYGEITRIFLSPEKASVYSIQEGLFVILLDSAKRIVINRYILSYDDIMAYEIIENNVVKFCEVVNTSETKTKTGSLIGRAIVGGVLLGGIGALAAGLTAKQETIMTTYQPSYTPQYIYMTMRIVVKGLDSHTIVIKGDKESELAEKLYAALYSHTTYSETWNRYVLDIKDVLSKIIRQNNSYADK